jgi:hypothetical protein
MHMSATRLGEINLAPGQALRGHGSLVGRNSRAASPTVTNLSYKFIQPCLHTISGTPTKFRVNII